MNTRSQQNRLRVIPKNGMAHKENERQGGDSLAGGIFDYPGCHWTSFRCLDRGADGAIGELYVFPMNPSRTTGPLHGHNGVT